MIQCEYFFFVRDVSKEKRGTTKNALLILLVLYIT